MNDSTNTCLSDTASYFCETHKWGNPCPYCEIADLRRELKQYQTIIEMLKIGSCTCMTKSPDHQYHYETCQYRLICGLIAKGEKG